MWSLVLCNQVLSELRRVLFTGSGGTSSNQMLCSFAVRHDTTITFLNWFEAILLCVKVGTRKKQTSAQTKGEITETTEAEKKTLPTLSFRSTYSSFIDTWSSLGILQSRKQLCKQGIYSVFHKNCPFINKICKKTVNGLWSPQVKLTWLLNRHTLVCVAVSKALANKIYIDWLFFILRALLL